MALRVRRDRAAWAESGGELPIDTPDTTQSEIRLIKFSGVFENR